MKRTSDLDSESGPQIQVLLLYVMSDLLDADLFKPPFLCNLGIMILSPSVVESKWKVVNV